MPSQASHRVARRFLASLGNQLQDRMEDLLGSPLDSAKGKALGEWLEDNFRFLVAKTPKGGKALKEDLNKLHWFLKFGLSQQQDPEKLRPTIEGIWAEIRKHLDEAVRLFTDEGGKVIPKEVRFGSNTYFNPSGLPEAQLNEYVKALEQVFDELKGWRKKALAGGLKIILAGPKEFSGTAAGKYKSSEDALLVRATPKILKRTRGTYGAFDYIIVHELGHRYEYKRRPTVDFDRQEWVTTPYSKNDNEKFAELFAISNFGINGSWDPTVEKFEILMTGGKVQEREPVELPEHLRKLVGK
jgi:hypothetical protein